MRPVVPILLAALLACTGTPAAAPPDPAIAYEKTCPAAVRIFMSEDRVEKEYREVALLPAAAGTGLVEEEAELRARRERAAEAGANGIILDATPRSDSLSSLAGPRLGSTRERAGAAVAIYIPEDARSARDICAGGDVNLARAADDAAPDALGYALQGAADTGGGAPPPAAAAAAGTAAAGAPAVADTLPARDTSAAAETEADAIRRLNSDRSMREALSDVVRLRIVTQYREVRPGLLVLTLGEGYETTTSLEYNLIRLHHAYRGVLYYQVPAVLELWRDGRKIGEFTRSGLLLEPDSLAAR